MRGIHLTLPGDATHSAATVPAPANAPGAADRGTDPAHQATRTTPTTSPRPSAPDPGPVNIPTSSGRPSVH